MKILYIILIAIIFACCTKKYYIQDAGGFSNIPVLELVKMDTSANKFLIDSKTRKAYIKMLEKSIDARVDITKEETKQIKINKKATIDSLKQESKKESNLKKLSNDSLKQEIKRNKDIKKLSNDSINNERKKIKEENKVELKKESNKGLILKLLLLIIGIISAFIMKRFLF